MDPLQIRASVEAMDEAAARTRLEQLVPELNRHNWLYHVKAAAEIDDRDPAHAVRIFGVSISSSIVPSGSRKKTALSPSIIGRSGPISSQHGPECSTPSRSSSAQHSSASATWAEGTAPRRCTAATARRSRRIRRWRC